MDKTLKHLPKLFVDKKIEKCIFEHVKVVAQLEIVIKWNKESDEMKSMFIAIE